jgi:DNA recombination protein RmuC
VAIEEMVKPLAESLKQYQDHINALEQSRQRAYGTLEEQLKSLSTLGDKLKTETGNLVNALRAPQVRGRWGEVTLRRVVELAGMSEHCDFTEQVSVDTEGGRLRPDMIVHLPSERDVVVDAKVSLSAYLEALEADTEEKRQALLLKHSDQVRSHMMRLSQKAYWDQFAKAPEFVVMFIPGESFFSAAIEQQHELLEDGMSRQVVLATPTTLIALLWAVAYGWRQQQLAENAQEISRLGKDIYDRMGKLADYVLSIGKGLDQAVHAYNQAVGSMEARLYPAARRFKELGAGTGEDIAAIKPVESTTRPLTPPETGED